MATSPVKPEECQVTGRPQSSGISGSPQATGTAGASSKVCGSYTFNAKPAWGPVPPQSQVEHVYVMDGIFLPSHEKAAGYINSLSWPLWTFLDRKTTSHT